ncbi:MAG TPA: DUF4422 domain-containing protein [Pelagibacteraceae bacterium]|jgi:hypothetical protein|nr:DUF4422 domain-containing protein [Pelagibacteraceae bacterium]
MVNLEIYCTALQYLNVLDKLPSYIKPLGLGNNNYPDHWLKENNGENISNLNKYYGEVSGIFWIWKNRLNDKGKNDWIGNCHYRKLWLNNLYNKKQKLSLSSLYTNLLSIDNQIFKDCDVVQIQPIILKKETLFQQFDKVHKNNVLKNCVDFLTSKEKEKFLNHLNGNKIYGLNMFITKTPFIKEYCENLFPWLKKCLDYCVNNNLCNNYNTRLPAFLAERYTSYWFSQNAKSKYLSYARLGNFMLSNNINKFINPTKIPFTFRMYPTIHDY